MKPIAFRIPHAILVALDRAAEKHHRTRTSQILCYLAWGLRRDRIKVEEESP